MKQVPKKKINRKIFNYNKLPLKMTMKGLVQRIVVMVFRLIKTKTQSEMNPLIQCNKRRNKNKNKNKNTKTNYFHSI